jgi:hypothetical protein
MRMHMLITLGDVLQASYLPTGEYLERHDRPLLVVTGRYQTAARAGAKVVLSRRRRREMGSSRGYVTAQREPGPYAYDTLSPKHDTTHHSHT